MDIFSTPCPFPQRHLLALAGVTRAEIEPLLDLAEAYLTCNRQGQLKHDCLEGRVVINLFFESSTRTLSSFELAAKRLGAHIIGIQPSTSSIKKGETLIDMAQTLNAMHPHILIIRHPESGVGALLAEKLDCAIINAGDGSHEHPTQALLDALTIRARKGHIEGLVVAICGDILHSRVARSNIHLLTTLGAQVRLIAPATLLPPQVSRLGAEVFHTMEEGLKGCDIIMMLRLQVERMHGAFVASAREYFHIMGLDSSKLALAHPEALIMHPGPINRGVEIDGSVADNMHRSLIQEQVEIGVALRMAVLDVISRNIP